jgi:alpha-D-xyloside xylohydrolase
MDKNLVRALAGVRDVDVRTAVATASRRKSRGITATISWTNSASIDELKYKLMPYVYAQAKDSSDHGLPMVRALFVEFPDDPGSWNVDDEYLFGSSILVAPLMEENATGRNVYLPPGTGLITRPAKIIPAAGRKSRPGKIPEIILVRDGTVLPHIALAQSTKQMDWSKLDLVVFAKDATTAKGSIFLPGDSDLHDLTLTKTDGAFKLDSDPSAGKVLWNIRQNSGN